MKPISGLITFLLLTIGFTIYGQIVQDSSLLSIDRIFASYEFYQNYQQPTKWIDQGEAYLIIEQSANEAGDNELIKYASKTGMRTVFISAKQLIPKDQTKPLTIEDFYLSPDESKVLLFTNSSRVWRSNSKGDFWVFDFSTEMLTKLGAKFEPSSLMFAKFSNNNQFVAYVHNFNIYLENFKTGKISPLTYDGTTDNINGTFDWVYEEEFGCRDGFRWNMNSGSIAFWNIDASVIGTYYLLNSTDSIYPKLIPIRYPKAGYPPSTSKVGVIEISTNKITWIPLPGKGNEYYIPGMQWVSDNILLIQQISRRQNLLNVWTYTFDNKQLKKIYTEVDSAWVDIKNMDITVDSWGENDLPLVNDNHYFLRLTEDNGWRRLFKINIETGKKIVLTPENFDVASYTQSAGENVYFMASPGNSTQRYLYKTQLKGNVEAQRVTPIAFAGVNLYNIAPNGKYAFHTYSSAQKPSKVNLIQLPNHTLNNEIISNEKFQQKLNSLKMPEIDFFKVTTHDGIQLDGRRVLPINFDSTKKYPVIFNFYGGPGWQISTDSWVGLWSVMMAQKGYVVIDMDNRGTPCLKGTEWRKCLYLKMGEISTRDLAGGIEEIYKWKFIDAENSVVWGWSAGGAATLHIMFQYPNLVKTGISVAAITDLSTYDNVYQERYMGLPQENKNDYVAGSAVTYAKYLSGNLLLIHGTGDDNVHYQNTEILINELIRQNKLFDLMIYPNRSHSIYEGTNTTRHLYSVITNYIDTHCLNNNIKNQKTNVPVSDEEE